MSLRPSLSTAALASSIASLLLLNGCFFDTLVKSPRSLAPGQKSLTVAAEYVKTSGTQVRTVTSLGDPTPGTANGSSNYWLSDAEFRMGTWYPGLEGGLALSMGGALTGDLKYQFYGYERNPAGQAGALDLELSASEPLISENGGTGSSSSAGYGIAGVLSFGDHFGPADLFIGGRLGMVDDGQNTNSDYNYDYYYNDFRFICPDRYSYYDLYLAGEMDLMARTSLVASVTMRTLLDQPYSTPGLGEEVYYGEQFSTHFDPIFFFSLGFKFHSRLRPLTPEEQKEKDARDEELAERLEAKRQRRAAKNGYDEPAPASAPDPAAQAKLAEGQKLMHAGDYQGALAAFGPLENPAAPVFSLEMSQGYCYYMLKDWNASLEHYQKALILAPDNDKLRATVAKLKKKAGAADDEDLLPK